MWSTCTKFDSMSPDCQVIPLTLTGNTKDNFGSITRLNLRLTMKQEDEKSETCSELTVLTSLKCRCSLIYETFQLLIHDFCVRILQFLQIIDMFLKTSSNQMLNWKFKAKNSSKAMP